MSINNHAMATNLKTIKDIYYIDITKNGKDYTGNRDISLLSNERAVLESVINILATEPGERVMQPTFGCRISKYLFQPLDPLTAIAMRNEITAALNNFEPRIENLKVIVTTDEPNKTFKIDLIFTMKVIKSQHKISLSLNKIR